MNALSNVLRREARVALSLRAQPLWFRIVKWVFALWFIFTFHARPWFGTVVIVALLAATAVHFLYRWKTGAWTRPWGGWNDVAAGRS